MFVFVCLFVFVVVCAFLFVCFCIVVVFSHAVSFFPYILLQSKLDDAIKT